MQIIKLETQCSVQRVNHDQSANDRVNVIIQDTATVPKLVMHNPNVLDTAKVGCHFTIMDLLKALTNGMVTAYLLLLIQNNRSR